MKRKPQLLGGNIEYINCVHEMEYFDISHTDAVTATVVKMTATRVMLYETLCHCMKAIGRLIYHGCSTLHL